MSKEVYKYILSKKDTQAKPFFPSAILLHFIQSAALFVLICGKFHKTNDFSP